MNEILRLRGFVAKKSSHFLFHFICYTNYEYFVGYFNIFYSLQKKCKEKKKNKFATKAQRHEATKILRLRDFVAKKEFTLFMC